MLASVSPSVSNMSMLPLSAMASANDVALQLAGTRRRVMGGLTGDVVLAFSFFLEGTVAVEFLW